LINNTEDLSFDDIQKYLTFPNEKDDLVSFAGPCRAVLQQDPGILEEGESQGRQDQSDERCVRYHTFFVIHSLFQAV
jgi:hypothetical protein